MIIIILSIAISSIMLGAMGSVVSWRRMSIIGDAIAHALVLSSVLSVIIDLPLYLLSIIIATCLAVLLQVFERKNLDANLNLGIISNVCIAVAILSANYMGGVRVLDSTLFGDVFSIQFSDLISIIIVAFISFIWLGIYFSQIVLSIFSREIAMVEGINTERIFLFLNIILGACIATSIAAVGTLTMSSSLIIPAAISRLITSTPQRMIISSCIISGCVSLFSIILSLAYDMPYNALLVMLYAIIYVMACVRSSFL